MGFVLRNVFAQSSPPNDWLVLENVNHDRSSANVQFRANFKRRRTENNAACAPTMVGGWIWIIIGDTCAMIYVLFSETAFSLPQRRLLFEEKPSHQLQTLPRIIAEHYEPFVVHCHNTFVHFTKLAKNKKKLENLIVSVHNRDDKKKKKREKQRHWGSVTWQNSLFLLFGRSFSLRRRSIQSFVVITNNETKTLQDCKE